MNKILDELKILNLIDLRNSKNAKYDDYFVFAKDRINSITSYEKFIFFKILLAKNGGEYALNLLESYRNDMDDSDFVYISNYISLNTGQYKKQLEYLNGIERPVGWIAREKVRCLLNCGFFDQAIALLDSLMDLNADFYRAFAINISYQLSDYSRVIKYSNDDSVECRLAKLGMGLTNKTLITSLYTHYSESQINIQKYSASNGGYIVSGCLGVTPDRFNREIKQMLTDRMDNIGILGASLGHMKMIEDFLDSDQEILVATESDAFLSYPLIDEVLKKVGESDFDFVLCSDRHTPGVYCDEPVSINKYNFLGRASGFDGYILNRAAANLILREFGSGRFNAHIDGLVIKWACNCGLISVGVTNVPVFSQSFTSVFSVRTLLELNY